MAVLLVLAAAVTIRYAVAHTGTFSSNTLENQWVLAVGLLLFSGYLILLWRTRVVVSPGAPAFTVKNSFRTHRIAWSDVDAIVHCRMWFGGSAGGVNWVIKVRLKNGSSIRCAALSGVGQTPLNLQHQLESLRVKDAAPAPG